MITFRFDSCTIKRSETRIEMRLSKVDTTLFTKKLGNDLFVMQIYVDGIIFGSTNQDFCEEFGKMMASEFESP